MVRAFLKMLMPNALFKKYLEGPLKMKPLVKEAITVMTTSLDVTQQADNRKTTWSKSQQSRKEAMKGPLFIQCNMNMQPRPDAAIEYVKNDPIHFTNENKVFCDGENADKDIPGHPKVYINLDNDKEYFSCHYCGKKFQMKC